MRRPSLIEALEARIAPAVFLQNPIADIIVGAGQKTSTIELEQVVDPTVTSPGRTIVTFTLNLDLDPDTPGIQLDTDPFTPGIQPPKIVLELYDDETPLTVQNFLRYVENPDKLADFIGTFFHRSEPGFVLQGGGYNTDYSHVKTFPAVHNEYSPERSNLRGTVAMAKVSLDPHSATSEWFINLADNSELLDGQNGGFTVFGEIVSGMDFVDQIVALPIQNLEKNSPFEKVPVQGSTSGGVSASNLITITGATVQRPADRPDGQEPAPNLQYELLSIVDVMTGQPSTAAVKGTVSGSSLKLNYTGVSGIVDVTVRITDPTDPDNPIIDTFRLTALPNLVMKISKDTLPSTVVPGDNGVISVTVSNNGGATFAGLINLNLYLSKVDGFSFATFASDGRLLERGVTLGPDPYGNILDLDSDLLVGAIDNKSVNLSSGGSVTITVPVTVAQQLFFGFDAYRLLGQVEAANASLDEQLFSDDKVAVNGGYHGIAAEFGFIPAHPLGVALNDTTSSALPPTFPARLGAVITFMNGEDLVTYSFKGAGTGKLTQNGDFLDLTVSGTNASTVLTQKSSQILNLGNIEITSTIGTVNLASADVNGYVTLSNGVKVLNLGNINGGDQRMIIGSFGAANSTGATLKFGSVRELRIESDQPIASLTAVEWIDESGTADQILAPSIKKLNITGRAGGNLPTIDGDFEADISLYRTTAVNSFVVKGAFQEGSLSTPGNVTAATVGSMVDSALSAKAINSIIVKGEMSGSSLSSAGNTGKVNVASMADSTVVTNALNSLLVKGFMTGSSVIASGNVKTVRLGGMIDSELFAGATARPESVSDFAASRSIGNFAIKGVGTEAILFQNSQVAAATISKIVVKGIDTTGSTEAFGFVADKVTSYARVGGPSRANLTAPQELDVIGNYSLVIL